MVFLLAMLTAAMSPGVSAQGFAALVSPPRFELAAKPGESLRQVMEITNASSLAAKYRMKTADWSLAENAAVTFDDALKPGSCRPWVAIESRAITVSAGGKHRYRFEVAVPADAAAGECRFAVLIEGDEQNVQTPGGPVFPIAGRLGVIVYVTIGAAEAKLDVAGVKVAMINGEAAPVLLVRNSGNAHGRLAGFLSGTDGAGKKLEFTPATLPILPGETREISLALYRDQDEPLKITYPITIRGKLEWGDKSMPFEQTFAR
ncbi:MAG: COG1470 family protein [Usitatibacter sp.]